MKLPEISAIAAFVVTVAIASFIERRRRMTGTLAPGALRKFQAYALVFITATSASAYLIGSHVYQTLGNERIAAFMREREEKIDAIIAETRKKHRQAPQTVITEASPKPGKTDASYFDASKVMTLGAFLQEEYEKTGFANISDRVVRIEATIIDVNELRILAVSNVSIGDRLVLIDFLRSEALDLGVRRAFEYEAASARSMRAVMREAGNQNWINYIDSKSTLYAIAKPAGRSRQNLPNGTWSDVFRYAVTALCTGTFFAQCVHLHDFMPIAH